MGDINCGNCGEPWESFYVYNDMTLGERTRFQTGKWCPSCKGLPVYVCRRYPYKYGSFDDPSPCQHFERYKCTAPENYDCEHRHHRKPMIVKYLISATENTDEDPLDVIHRALGDF